MITGYLRKIEQVTGVKGTAFRGLSESQIDLFFDRHSSSK